MTDEALVRRAKAGDELAMRRLLNRHECLVRMVCANYFMAGADRDDLFQEGRYGLLKAVNGYRSDMRVEFRAFVFLCVRRQVISAVIAANRVKHQSLNEAVSLNQPVIGGDDWEDPPLAEVLADPAQREPCDVLTERDELATVIREVRGLSDLERQAMSALAEGRPYVEVADAIGGDAKQVDNAAQRGRRKVRRALGAAA